MTAKRSRGRPRVAGQLIHVRVAPDLYRALKARAASDGRTLSKTVERLLQAALQKGKL